MGTITLFSYGAFTLPLLIASIVIAPLFILSAVIGVRYFRESGNEHFRKAALVVLALIAIMLIYSNFWKHMMTEATLVNLIEHRNDLQWTCESCHRAVEGDVDELIKKLGDQTELPAIAKQSKCTEWGLKEGAGTIVSRETLDIKGEYKNTTT